jgi:hypothetical protein
MGSRQAEDGGVFRSEDGGKTWTKVNSDRSLRQRAWYSTRIYADSQRMVQSNDGGANVTSNGGRSWTTQGNQPTAQFYRVAIDNDFPYNIYGAQQDNTTVKIASHSVDGSIDQRDWHTVGGCESGWIAPSPRNSNIGFAGCYGGYLRLYDHRAGQSRNVMVWPDNLMGHGAADLKYRFQWNFPILFSLHDAGTLYAAANALFKTTNEGPAGGDDEEGPRAIPRPPRVTTDAGLNRVVWDMRHPDASRFPGLILWAGNLRGPLVVPGTYQVRLTTEGKNLTQTFRVNKDPRIETTVDEFNKQSALLLQTRDKLAETHDPIGQTRDVRKQVDDVAARAKENKAIAEAAKTLAARLTAIEEELYQTKNQSNQDPLNYPIRLNNRLAALAGVVASADAAPTQQSYQLAEELTTLINAQLTKFRQTMREDLERFNKLVRDQNIPAVAVKGKSS